MLCLCNFFGAFEFLKRPRYQKKGLFAKDFAIFEMVKGLLSFVPQGLPGLACCKFPATMRNKAGLRGPECPRYAGHGNAFARRCRGAVGWLALPVILIRLDRRGFLRLAHPRQLRVICPVSQRNLQNCYRIWCDWQKTICSTEVYLVEYKIGKIRPPRDGRRGGTRHGI